MEKHNGVSTNVLVFTLLSLIAGCLPASGLAQEAPAASVDPAQLPTVGTVDERYQSYNVEYGGSDGGQVLVPVR